jgi:hypothetical protein
MRGINNETFFIRRRKKIHHWSLPGEPTCSNTGERGQHEETSGGDFSCGGDPEGASGGVLAPLGDGLPSLEGERTCLMPLLSCIDCKGRAKKVNPIRERRKKIRDGYQRKTEGDIYSPRSITLLQ